MNTKQVLYNALKSQLETKEQEYELYHKTVTIPAIEEVNNDIKQFFNMLTPIDEASFDIGSSRINIRANENDGWYRNVEVVLQSTYKSDDIHVGINWNSGTFNLRDKIQNKIFIDLISVCANNLKAIEDKWINDWYEKRRQIDKNDDTKSREHIDLKNALNSLRNEIIEDTRESMKQIGFEIKKFKDVYDLDWDYDKDENGSATKRIYKINTVAKAIKLQIGRSMYDTTWINGFKVLGKKGNKYKIEAYRENYDGVYNYEVLEKKFDSFVDEVSDWENNKADKRKNETEESYKQRSQQQ
jgi:hypothetical protein